jgi:TonB family protein
MALRCLLFSATEDEVRPIWQVLSDLGVEGEFCANGREAVQKVATGTFQIVIADWAEQAQAAAILKTAREQKAANRPLALAIVNEDARLAEALRAGANSALVRPLRVDAVRDTLKTACELLRAKQSQAAAGKSAPKPQGRAMGASAGAGAGQTYVGVPVTSFMPTAGAKAEDKKLRAGEFLQSSPPAPSAQFETESDVQRSKDLASGEPMDALKELEPMASAVRASGTQAATAAENPGALTGWASLQARLNKVAPPPPPEAAKEQALSAYGDTPSFAAAAAAPAKAREQARPEWRGNSALEASLPAYMAEDSTEAPTPVEPAAEKGSGRVVWLAAVALILGALLAVPRTRQMLWRVTGSGAKAGQNWLNPKPAPLPQPVPLHDSFGQSGDEYKLPVAENIPDATTDPSQIRIVPVIDPTAKAGKNSGANGAADAAGSSAAGDGTTESGIAAAQNPADTAAASSPAQGQGAAAATPVNASGVPHAAPAMQPRGNPAAGNSAIPSSLQSQTASSIPDSAGAKPVEAAMSSIEPVVLPETAAWTLLAQPVEAEYPAKAAGQRGSVLLQVLIARDGTVQDAKFVQGSLVFARSAIDAVKQWKFKPYVMNGRAVQVQSSITLNFKPPV